MLRLEIILLRFISLLLLRCSSSNEFPCARLFKISSNVWLSCFALSKCFVFSTFSIVSLLFTVMKLLNR